MANLEELGYVVREARENKKLTQAELGNRLSVSRATIGLLETGQVKYPRIDMLTAIATILDIPTAHLYQLAGVTLSDAGSAQMQWLASQLSEDRVDLLVAIGHTMLQEQGRQQAKAAPKAARQRQ